jgi:hypothetical protein
VRTAYLTTFMKSGSLNLLEPSGIDQACNGIVLPLPLPLPFSVVAYDAILQPTFRRRCRITKTATTRISAKNIAKYTFHGAERASCAVRV